MNEKTLCGEEYESFVSYIQNLTDDQKWVALRNIPAEMLWQDLYARFKENQTMVEDMKKITRA